ncbi:LysM peptidoglycan-binding domain-containing protein [Halobacillus sp. A5]|uniref:LysM peptidoglycan-binding domain-containing protein n=1 Tax=Halobacillus sp. A5 TaxID=2880263 RepID=UPI0020A6C5FB|nr:LysM peptidoglycan-binding domain-containing protein [Halobacillus sp. A5]MCP3028969.1 LysM peptidoglycan-binding domain-containing protein [Halobacillus sp. A5]
MKKNSFWIIFCSLFITAAITVPLSVSAEEKDLQTTIHMVEEGEYLSVIALEYDVTMEEIAEANDMETTDYLYAGQELVIPVEEEILDLSLPLENSEERTKEVTHVMTHFTSNAALTPQNPYSANDIYDNFVDYGVSAHYMIGRDGEIYQLVDEDRAAFHAGDGSLSGFPEYDNDMNQRSIGIELLALGTEEEMSSMMSPETYQSIDSADIGYTEDQYKALDKLLEDIEQRHPAIQRDRDHIVGHDEYAPDLKTDPGSLFKWSEIGLSQTREETQVHTVKEGDYLWGIANEYDTTSEVIAEANGMDSRDPLWIGQELIIPE